MSPQHQLKAPRLYSQYCVHWPCPCHSHLDRSRRHSDPREGRTIQQHLNLCVQFGDYYARAPQQLRTHNVLTELTFQIICVSKCCADKKGQSGGKNKHPTKKFGTKKASSTKHLFLHSISSPLYTILPQQQCTPFECPSVQYVVRFLLFYCWMNGVSQNSQKKTKHFFLFQMDICCTSYQFI